MFKEERRTRAMHCFRLVYLMTQQRQKNKNVSVTHTQ